MAVEMTGMLLRKTIRPELRWINGHARSLTVKWGLSVVD
jgi:hypothetical protein